LRYESLNELLKTTITEEHEAGSDDDGDEGKGKTFILDTTLHQLKEESVGGYGAFLI
jgi:hypothetical protein